MDEQTAKGRFWGLVDNPMISDNINGFKGLKWPPVAASDNKQLDEATTYLIWLGGKYRRIKLENKGYTTPCWIWQQTKFRTGYALVVTDKARRAHRVSFSEMVGPIPPGLHVCHRCDQPACVRPDHLFLGTAKDNQQDKSRKGRAVGGLKNPDIQKLGQIAAANARRAK